MSTQFDDVVTHSPELSEQKGPLRVVTQLDCTPCLEEATFPDYSSTISMELQDGRAIECEDYAELSKRLKCANVQNMR